MTTNEWFIAIGTMLILPVILIPLSLIMIKLGRGFNTFSRAALTREGQIFAAQMMGRMMIRAAIVMIVIILACGGIGLAVMGNETIVMVLLWIAIVVPIVMIVIAYILTELAVRRSFDKDGRPYK